MKNSQYIWRTQNEKGFVVPVIIIIVIVSVIIVAYFNQDKILNSSIGQYFGNKFGICIIEENLGKAISPNIAQAVALKHANENNKPFKWVPVGYYSVFGSDNVVNYYAFIFRKSEFTKYTTLNDLEQNASKYSDTTANESDNKYRFNDIASVLTGTTEGDALIIRHYRGIPEVVGKKIEIKKYIENKYSDKTIGNIISDTSMGKFYFEIVNKTNSKATGEIVGLNYSVISMTELVNYQDEIKNRTNKQYMSFDKKECDSYKQALSEREVDLKNQWEKYNQ